MRDLRCWLFYKWADFGIVAQNPNTNYVNRILPSNSNNDDEEDTIDNGLDIQHNQIHAESRETLLGTIIFLSIP